MHPAKDALATPGGVNIHTLNPPKCAVAPIAPFIGDHQLSEELSAVALIQFCDDEEAMRRGFDQGNGPELQAAEIKVPECAMPTQKTKFVM